MDVKQELEELLNDPLFDTGEDDSGLFDLTDAMKRAAVERKEADYVAQRRPCENFADYEEGFRQVHRDLREGKRKLKKYTSKAMQEGRYYVAGGVLVYLDRIIDPQKPLKGHIAINGRTHTIYENGMESDIMLHTLAKSIYTDGYVVTDSSDSNSTALERAFGVEEGDVTDGYIYVLSSLSTNPEIAGVKNLYKIGFSTTPVEERIKNCEHEPTYLMDKVRIVATWRVCNMNTHKLESLIHQFFKAVQFHVRVKDAEGREAVPQEWFVVPLAIIDKVIGYIEEGGIVNYRYNPALQMIEEVEQEQRLQQGNFDTTGWKILTLNIKQVHFDMIWKGEKKIEYRQLKPSNQKRYTWINTDGKHYLRKYDALRFVVGRSGNRMLVEVTDTTYDAEKGNVEYHLGKVLQVDIASK